MPRVLKPIDDLTASGRRRRLRREQDPEYAARMRQEGKDYAKAHPGEYYHKNRNLVRSRGLLVTYGITLEEYNKRLQAQRGKCAICGQKATGRPPSRASLHLDHDHKTGKLRAFICPDCNLLLGLAKENPGRLRKAASYLESWQ
jgi:hypothetical protein